jgi:hypothetical protein
VLSFQISNSGRTIVIDCDDAGISNLINFLNKLRGSGSHVHLWGPSAGGKDLDETTPYGEAAVSEVIISHGGD